MTVMTDLYHPVSPIKVWRRHNCTRNHRTHLTLAKCMFRKAWYVHEGEFGSLKKPLKYAVVFRCIKRHERWTPPRVTLYATPESAKLKAKSYCGGGCYGNHDIIEMEK